MQTYSIIAQCPHTKALGVATVSDRRAIGAFSMAIRPEIGGCVIQGVLNPLYQGWILAELARGLTPDEAILAIRLRDQKHAHRQILAISADGIATVRTGRNAPSRSADYIGQGFAVAGSGLRDIRPVEEIVRSFNQTIETTLPLGNRLLGALEMAQLSGGGIKGEPQSAALLIWRTVDAPATDLRVDCHRDSVSELRRLYDIHVAFRNQNPALFSTQLSAGRADHAAE